LTLVLDILRWWLTVEVLGIVALPLALALFRRLGDRGVSAAKPLGILLVSYVAWLFAMLGFGGLSVGMLAVGVLVVLGLGWYAMRRVRVPLRATLRTQLPAILFHEAVFAGALYIGLLLRWRGMYGPQINHTETPMDFAFLNGILASTSFPPQDPWLSGYPINYYYFGYVMVAALTRLSGLPSAITFNLACATIYALTATGVAGIVWNLISHERTTSGAEQQVPRRPSAGRGFAALMAAALVLIAANQVAALQWITRTERVVALRGGELAAAVGQYDAADTITLPEPLPAISETDWGLTTTLPLASSRRAAVSSWWPSRAVWDELPRGDDERYRTYTITEFPFFSFLLGDLHPHVLALPWTLLAIALAFNLLTRQSAPEWSRRGYGLVELGVTAIVLGGLYAINSWDLPTYVLLFGGAMLLLYLRLAPVVDGRRKIVWMHVAQQGLVLLVACWAVWLPFHMTFASLVGGQGSPLGIAPARTPLAQFVIIFGIFAVPLAALLLRYVQGSFAFSQTLRVPAPLAAVLAVVLLLVVGQLIGWPLLALLPIAVYAIREADHQSAHPARAFVLWATALGALVLWGTDIVYLRDAFEGSSPRMNTLFKFFYQVWLLWGTLTGFALWVLLRRLRPMTALWAMPFAVLLMGALVYPALTPNRNPGIATLDGTEYIARERPGDAAGIAWVAANVAPTATVLQAPFHGGYQAEYASVATVTGRPTLLGWRGHEAQWRAGQPTVSAEVEQRLNDATAIYTTTDVDYARELIEQYNIDYVYVGPVEEQFAAEKQAPPDALLKFEDFMDVAWSDQGVTIYQRR
jgi:YYY domain-containing protein